ncbi:MAG: hypothetical protein ACRC6X_06920 [Culicoidibacterales bacterium]
MSFLVLVAVITLMLVLPTAFIKQKHKLYVKEMEKTITITTIDSLRISDIKKAMVEADEILRTKAIREMNYNYFVEYFTEQLIQSINTSSSTRDEKLTRLMHANEVLTMNFKVVGLKRLASAIEVLTGDVIL